MILHEDIYRYNYKRVHSTTKEIPVVRYERAVEAKQTLFKRFEIKKPYEKPEDIFCYRTTRVVNAYRKISLNKLEFSISGVPIREVVELRISFDLKNHLATIRFWYRGGLVGQQQVKAEDLAGVQF